MHFDGECPHQLHLSNLAVNLLVDVIGFEQ